MSAFAFTREPIDARSLAAPLAHDAGGGFASFEGRVRDHNEGRRVTGLEYEAYESLGVAEGERIVAAALARHGALAARCVHRLGSLAVGDVAVWVGVTAAHRGEAFAACREIIDEVKHRLPIWKKEHYEDGTSGWVGCAHHDPAPRFDYSRQAALPEVGAAGQARLAAAHVVVAGAGGLGCAALASLAGAGVGTLTIVDGDRVEPSNLHRQPLYAAADVGRPKAEAAAQRLAAYNPAITVRAVAARLDAGNADAIVGAADVVLECTDNFATKFLVNDAAQHTGRPVIVASVHQYEGQVQVVRPDVAGSCLRCVWPEATRDGLVGNCAEAGVLGPVPAVLGQLQATEALKLLLGLPGQLRDAVAIVDLLGLRIAHIAAPRDAACARGCVRARVPHAAPAEGLDLALPLAAVARAGYRIVDVREPEECAHLPLPVPAHANVPMRQLAERGLDLDPGERYVLVCAHGVRSRAAAEWLRERGAGNVWSLRGGLAAQAQTGEP